jgi:hypothetical protein
MEVFVRHEKLRAEVSVKKSMSNILSEISLVKYFLQKSLLRGANFIAAHSPECNSIMPKSETLCGLHAHRKIHEKKIVLSKNSRKKCFCAAHPRPSFVHFRVFLTCEGIFERFW